MGNTTAYRENLAWLYGLQKFGIKLGLENMQRLIEAAGIALAGERWNEASPPQSPGQSPASQKPTVFHVAGTNGKGSVCAMIESICRAHGLRTGLFTSPHLVTFRERIKISGVPIAEEDVANGLAQIRAMIADWDPHPTFFEVTTALALKHFKNSEADVAILETGMGGRLDATNAVQSSVAVITPIGLDHQKWLGDTIEEIAFEKAGIIKPHTPAVSSPQDPAAEAVLRSRASICEAPIQFVTQPYNGSPVGLAGAHQKRNAALAIAAVRVSRIEASPGATAYGLRSLQWPARFQKWDQQIIIDGAHNPAAAGVLAATWREVFGEKRATIILAVLADKDAAGIWGALAPI
ncbi:MAG TPA: folylpolyglutamate synthase/dihydrofolate synthase family protein, partial [Chthoniobacterales bacterium]|nr:folylpolyglutamate synthase/dihydrofolate synthase family protein [Chthoniobacterales bacterium]